DQVRRMPAALVVIVDQSLMQDVLLALSNSDLRFQITQMSWTRYRGPLEGLNSNSAGQGPGGSEYIESFSSRSGSSEGSRPGGLLLGQPPGGRGPGGFPGGPGSGPGPVSIPGGGGPPFPGGGSGFPGGPGSEGGFGGTLVSESQVTSGLVELTVYGVVTLYEKYEVAKPTDPNNPDPNAPNNGPPAPGNNTPPKSRRRFRA
ncbi:MAG: hypothetical protein K2V38_26580, partial [Gemmataceae bacterium]|nr:hypothetical protein [Gemmataceae bacterium]